MPAYSGSCHCGSVGFRIDADIDELTTCDCSLCTRKNAVMAKVPERAFVITAGPEWPGLRAGADPAD